jgi:hypothetical protein
MDNMKNIRHIPNMTIVPIYGLAMPKSLQIAYIINILTLSNGSNSLKIRPEGVQRTKISQGYPSGPPY